MEKTHKRLPVPLMSLGRTIFRQFPNCAQVTFESMKNQGCNRFWERMLNQILIFWKFFQLRNKRTAHTRRLFRKPTLETNLLYIVVFHFTVFYSYGKCFTFFWLSLCDFFHCLCTDQFYDRNLCSRGFFSSFIQESREEKLKWKNEKDKQEKQLFIVACLTEVFHCWLFLLLFHLENCFVILNHFDLNGKRGNQEIIFQMTRFCN